jgi:hypothetical protein
MGIYLPRREVLLGLAASIAATAVPVRPARAVPLAAIAILVVTLAEQTYKVFKPTNGTFKAKNDDDAQVKGYVQISVTDDHTDTNENSITAWYSFPANTNITVNFNKGPTATTKGDKTLTVESANDSDDDSFTAV